MNNGKISYLAIFVIAPDFVGDIDNPNLFMGSYEGTSIPLDFMATWGTALHGQGKCVVFDSLCDFGYKMRAGASIDVKPYGDADNYDKTDEIVTIDWSVDGVASNADYDILLALKDQTRRIIVFDPLLNRVEQVIDGVIRLDKNTTGQKKEVFNFHVERYGTKSQFYTRFQFTGTGS